MNSIDDDTIDTTWHFRVSNNCDQVLNRLSTVIHGLHRQRRRSSVETVNLAIYQDSWSPASTLGEAGVEPQSV
jgi:hypothetical protein